MRNLVAIVLSVSTLVATRPQPPRRIPMDRAMEAIRGFRSLALQTAHDTEQVSFCGIADAYDGSGRLRRTQAGAALPYDTRDACKRTAPSARSVADGVYFESVRVVGDSLIFRAKRKFGTAISWQEYTVARVGQTVYLRVSLCVLGATPE